MALIRIRLLKPLAPHAAGNIIHATDAQLSAGKLRHSVDFLPIGTLVNDSSTVSNLNADGSVNTAVPAYVPPASRVKPLARMAPGAVETMEK